MFQSINSGYSGIIPSTMSKFITQEPIFFNGASYPNQFHADPLPTRTAKWIFKQMESSYNVSLSSLVCNRPCPPSGLPELSLNKGLLCVGERISFLNNTGIWTGITVTSSANLGFDNATKQIEALSEGYAWINASIRLGDCDVYHSNLFIYG